MYNIASKLLTQIAQVKFACCYVPEGAMVPDPRLLLAHQLCSSGYLREHGAQESAQNSAAFNSIPICQAYSKSNENPATRTSALHSKTKAVKTSYIV